MNIAALDLNLLVIFDALFVERSVTRAAKRVGLSQPAASNALRRLRERLGDALFVPTSRGLEPTSRAHAIAPPIRRALAELEGALAPPAIFDPGRARRTFVMMMSDVGELALMPRLTARLAGEAPGVDVRVVAGPTGAPEDVLAAPGAPDLMLSLASAPGRGTHHQALYAQRFVGLARRGHRCLRRKMTLKRFIALDHLLIAPRGLPGGVVDDALARRGMRRRIALTLANFFSAAMVVAETDLVLVAPAMLAQRATAILSVRTFVPPLPLPQTSIAQYWHATRDDDPGHRWLRAAVADAGHALAAELR